MNQERHTEELEHVQLQINAKTDESLECTRRIVQHVLETQDIGEKTLGMLNSQGEQLDNIERGLMDINEGMKEAEKNLEGLEKCCGLCVLPWRRTKKHKKCSDNTSSAGKDRGNGKTSNDAQTFTATDQSQLPQGGFITRITNDAREDEMDRNLADVSVAVEHLKSMATTMGNVIDQQNVQLDRITNQAEMADGRIQKADKRANKIIKKI